MTPKQRRGCGRGVSANPCKGMKDVGKNHHLITPNITTDSGMDHQWMLKHRVKCWRIGCSRSLQVSQHGPLIICEGETGRSHGRCGGHQHNHVAKAGIISPGQRDTVGTHAHSVLRDNVWSGSNCQETESRMPHTLVVMTQERTIAANAQCEP